MKKLTLKLKTVTPLFIGGADPEQPAEIREPSIKGALRFWFRAIYPNYTRADEERIFGSTGRQSGVLLRITDRPQAAAGQKGDGFDKHTAYLGYGAILYNKNSTNGKDKKSEAERPYFTKGKTFTLNLLFKPSLSEDDRHKVERSLWAWITFGGLGARSRRGFGSLMVKSIEGNELDKLSWRFNDNTTLTTAIKAFINSIADKPSSLAEYTCFSADSQCVVLLSPDKFSKFDYPALEYIGEQMLNYRSYNAEKNFQDDHDIMCKYLTNNTKPPSCPKRAAFGLPHNYFFSSSYKSGSVNFVEGDKEGRRASPLFISVQELVNRRYAVVVTFLPAIFLSDGGQVTISGGEDTPHLLLMIFPRLKILWDV